MCNCRDQRSCPLESKCLQQNVVYKETITTNSETKECIGSTGGPFKQRWYSHISDIRNEKNNGAELLKHVWKLENKKTSYEIKWDIMHKIGEVMNISKLCKTCNLEKKEIALANEERNLNKRQDFFHLPAFQKIIL